METPLINVIIIVLFHSNQLAYQLDSVSNPALGLPHSNKRFTNSNHSHHMRFFSGRLDRYPRFWNGMYWGH